MPEWWVGRKHSEETKAKMRAAHLGAKNHFFGKHFSEKSKRRLSESLKGKLAGERNPNYGKPRPKRVRLAISRTRIAKGVARGELNPNWKGGGHFYLEQWRAKVLTRDNYTCRTCGLHGKLGRRAKDLTAHHIKKSRSHPKLRYVVSNGLTMCNTCHMRLHRREL